MVTCYKQGSWQGRVEDSYKVTIDFRYDMAYIDQHEKTFNVVYTDNSFTNDKKNNWTGDQTRPVQADRTFHKRVRHKRNSGL